jgi:hypothetical protein
MFRFLHRKGFRALTFAQQILDSVVSYPASNLAAVKNYFVTMSCAIHALSACLVFLSSTFFHSDASAAGSYSALSVHHGFLLPHHAAMKGLQTQHLQMFEAEIGFPFYKSPQTDALYFHPLTSLLINYSGLGNMGILGDAFSMVPAISFAHGAGKKYRFGFRGGMGLSYLPKVFSINTNFRNTALSNNINAAVLLRYGFEFFPSKAISFSAGIGFSHFSNGSFAVPNLGLNLLTAYGRIALNQPCIPHKYGRELRDSLRKNFAPFRKWVFMVSGALKEVYPVLTPKFPVFHAQTALWHFSGPKGAWITALGVYYDQSLRHHLLNDEDKTNDRDIIWQVGAEGGYVFIIHKLMIPVQLGAYVFDQYKRTGTVYSRLGLRYRLGDKFAAGITLKTHYFKASFFDLGLSFMP